MKNILLKSTLALAIIYSSFASAQQSVTLNIHHKLDAKDFGFGTQATSNLDQTFTVDRLEYYLSEISITHDNGMVTNIDELWVLVDAGSETSISLGDYDINIIEGVSFHVGVNADVNHNDPSLWPMSHPLAPKSPSMHWGWSAGYRFVAMEGSLGLSADFELHGLGDANYFTTEVGISDTADNGVIVMDVYANYVETLRDIDVSAGVISHGETGAAKTCLENLRDYVFSATEMADTTTEDTTDANGIVNVGMSIDVQIAPNPSASGNFTATFSHVNVSNLNLRLIDLTGNDVSIQTSRVRQDAVQFRDLPSGLYFLRVQDPTTSQSVVKKISVL
jgi:hypothetical protein